MNSLLSLFGVPALLTVALATGSSAEEPPQQSQRGSPAGSPAAGVYKDRITPHWFHDNNRFWYRNDLRAGTKEFVVVNAERGTREPAFDAAKLAAALSKASGTKFAPDKPPFDSIEFSADAKSIQFKAGDDTWSFDLNSNTCSRTKPVERHEENIEPRTGRGQRAEASDSERTRSPDGQWTALIKDHNLFIKARDGAETQLSTNGTEEAAFGRFSWAPDSKTLLAFRVTPGERKEVYLVQSSPSGGGRAKLQTRPYPLPGDKFATYEPNVFDVATRTQTRPEVDRFEHEWLRPRPHWSPDGERVAYEQVDRGHQRLRVLEIQARTGKTRNIIDEKTDTFIWTAHTEALGSGLVTWLETSGDILYLSESNGWRHMYLVDGLGGKLKNPITSGNWVVRGIDRIDETNRCVWFRASGVYENQDPYLIHFGRVNFDGSGLVFLTTGDGNHGVQFSPDRRFVVDTYSRVDMAPRSELRRVSDGGLICKLEDADITELKKTGWKPPEVFVAKGRDGKTDIWGIIQRPRDFNPRKKYPLLEDIYAGPQGSFVPKTFSATSRYESLTKLGFVVVKIDGMGTANRSKAFHDVCWHNLKDAGFEDRIRWMTAAAAKHREMDISRVGIYGTSAGGQNAAAAVLFHPEFYKAAVANCGCHDNRMDKASWNEQWMGYPVGPHYAECSNIENAGKLTGHLFLVVGEMDNNVPPESTYRFADALIKVGKDFEFLVVPGGGHGAGGAYGQRRLQDFFVRHLLGEEPPNRNASEGNK